MSGQRLGRARSDSGVLQAGNERVPVGVKVGEQAVLVSVGDADPLRVNRTSGTWSSI